MVVGREETTTMEYMNLVTSVTNETATPYYTSPSSTPTTKYGISEVTSDTVYTSKPFEPNRTTTSTTTIAPGHEFTSKPLTPKVTEETQRPWSITESTTSESTAKEITSSLTEEYAKTTGITPVISSTETGRTESESTLSAKVTTLPTKSETPSLTEQTTGAYVESSEKSTKYVTPTITTQTGIETTTSKPIITSVSSEITTEYASSIPIHTETSKEGEKLTTLPSEGKETTSYHVVTTLTSKTDEITTETPSIKVITETQTSGVTEKIGISSEEMPEPIGTTTPTAIEATSVTGETSIESRTIPYHSTFETKSTPIGGQTVAETTTSKEYPTKEGSVSYYTTEGYPTEEHTLPQITTHRVQEVTTQSQATLFSEGATEFVATKTPTIHIITPQRTTESIKESTGETTKTTLSPLVTSEKIATVTPLSPATKTTTESYYITEPFIPAEPFSKEPTTITEKTIPHTEIITETIYTEETVAGETGATETPFFYDQTSSIAEASTFQPIVTSEAVISTTSRETTVYEAIKTTVPYSEIPAVTAKVEETTLPEVSTKVVETTVTFPSTGAEAKPTTPKFLQTEGEVTGVSISATVPTTEGKIITTEKIETGTEETSSGIKELITTEQPSTYKVSSISTPGITPVEEEITKTTVSAGTSIAPHITSESITTEGLQVTSTFSPYFSESTGTTEFSTPVVTVEQVTKVTPAVGTSSETSEITISHSRTETSIGITEFARTTTGEITQGSTEAEHKTTGFLETSTYSQAFSESTNATEFVTPVVSTSTEQVPVTVSLTTSEKSEITTAQSGRETSIGITASTKIPLEEMTEGTTEAKYKTTGFVETSTSPEGFSEYTTPKILHTSISTEQTPGTTPAIITTGEEGVTTRLPSSEASTTVSVKITSEGITEFTTEAEHRTEGFGASTKALPSFTETTSTKVTTSISSTTAAPIGEETSTSTIPLMEVTPFTLFPPVPIPSKNITELTANMTKETCNTDRDCIPSETCTNNTCINPCTVGGTCGINAICFVHNHTAICKCPNGLRGDPNNFCRQGIITY